LEMPPLLKYKKNNIRNKFGNQI
jgi:hypothetical protein